MATYDRPWEFGWWIYPGANPQVTSGLWGIETDVTAYVKEQRSEGGGPITYSGGRRGESAQSYGAVDYGDFSCTVDNKDGRFSPDNVMGAYWPDLDLNTPMRWVCVTGRDTFTRVVGVGLGTSDSGSGYSGTGTWAVNGSAAVATLPLANSSARQEMTGSECANYDVTFTCWTPVTATGGSLSFGLIQRYNATNALFYLADFTTAGNVNVRIVQVGDDGTFTLVSATAVGSYSPGEKFTIRCQREGAQTMMKIWETASSQPAAWNLSTYSNRIPPGSLGMYGQRASANTNANAQFLFDDLRILSLEWTGFLTELPVVWDMTGRNCWAPIKASGVLRRLRQKATGSVISTLRRQLPFYAPTDYWPMEDGTLSTSLANAVNPSYPAKISNMVPAQENSLPGALREPAIGSGGGYITAFASKPQGGTGFGALVFFKLTTPPPASAALFRVTASRGPVRDFTVLLDGSGSPSVTLTGTAPDGSTVFSTGTSPGSTITNWDDDWFAMIIKTEQSGPDVIYRLQWYKLGGATTYFFDGTYTSTIVPVAKTVNLGGVSWPAGTAFAHLWLGPNDLPFVTASFFDAATGFNGETAAARVKRVADEAGLQVNVLVPVVDSTTRLGPQPQGKAIEIIQAAADADFGWVYEEGNGIGYLTRVMRRNQAVLMNLSVASRHIAAPPRPIRDDQRIRNNVTVSRTGGSSANAKDQDHIERFGEYEESTALNLYSDDDLQPQAQWRRAVGTRRFARWTSIQLSFTKNAQLLPAWRSRTFGPRLAITTGRTQMVGADPNLIVEGWQATVTPKDWTLDLVCSDAKVWDTGRYDDPVAGRSKYGPSAATLNAGITSSATSMAVNSGGETWVSGVVPLTVSVDGEHIAVGNISPPGSVVVDDGGFEAGIANWTATAGTFSASAAQARTGTGSALITVSGAPASVGVRIAAASRATVVAAASYTLTFWIFSSITTANVNGVINWYNGAAFLSSSGGSLLSVTANTWTKYTMTFAAPATATRAEYGGTLGGTPPNGTLVYFDDVDLADASSQVMQFRQLTRSVNGVVKSHLSGAAVTFANQATYGF